jgi:uncharacterized protein YjiS (DUF1127 family)
MNARIIEEQAALFPHAATTRMTRETEIEAIRFAAIRARDEALAAGLRKLFTRIGQGLATAGRALHAWPERRRTYDSLRALTDRELADIGMARGDIARVFEPGFALPAKQAANGNRVGAGAVAAA